jgi:hypothetical protein
LNLFFGMSFAMCTLFFLLLLTSAFVSLFPTCSGSFLFLHSFPQSPFLFPGFVILPFLVNNWILLRIWGLQGVQAQSANLESLSATNCLHAFYPRYYSYILTQKRLPLLPQLFFFAHKLISADVSRFHLLHCH